MLSRVNGPRLHHPKQVHHLPPPPTLQRHAGLSASTLPTKIMSNQKIKKAGGAEPDEFEAQVAQELLNLEMTSTELKASLSDLHITAAKEVDCGAGRKAIIMYVPYKLQRSFQKVQARLVRELEKKFSGRHVIIVAQRNILGKSYARSQKTKGLRPRSRTLTAVQDAILEDIVYPTEITGKRTRCKVDGRRVLKVYLDGRDQANVEGRTDTYAAVYGKLTNKQVSFHFSS